MLQVALIDWDRAHQAGTSLSRGGTSTLTVNGVATYILRKWEDWFMTTALIGLLGVILGAVTSAFVSNWLQKRRISDREQFYSWRVAFDRAAFRGPYSYHSDQQPFIKAMKQTISAINTGLMTSGGQKDTEHRGKGKSQLRRADWRNSMGEVEKRLHKIVVALEARLSGVPVPYVDPDAVDIDAERNLVVGTMNGIWRQLNIPTLALPTEAEMWPE